MSKANKKHEVKKKPVDISVNPDATRKLKNTLEIIIAAFAFILYAQSISFDYALDDKAMIKDNSHTIQGFKGIPDIIKKDYWEGYTKGARTPEYRPTSLIMFATEWALFPGNPHVGHLMNVLLFSITCWVLFLLLCKLFEKRNLIFPFIITLLYAAHPIHTEVVDNIKSRDEILCFLFFVLTSLLLFNYIKTNSIKTLILALISFTICIFSKESGITYIVIIPLLLFFFSSSDYKKILKLSLLLAVPVVAYLLIRSQILLAIPLNSAGELPNTTFISASDFISREATAFFILIRYISLLIFPHPLAYDYGFAEVTVHTIGDPVVLLSILVYSIIGIYAIITIRKKNVLAFAILFYFITLSPVSNLFILIGSSITMAERFMYAPSLGFCIALTILLVRLTKTDAVKKKFNSIKEMVVGNAMIFTIVFIIVCLYAVKTYSRSMDWKSDVTLFRHDIATAGNSSTIHHNWGTILLYDLYPDEKNQVIKDSLLNLSIKELKKAISIYDKDFEYHYLLATAYMRKNDNADAIVNFELYKNNYPHPHNDVYKNLGTLYLKAEQYDKAITVMDSLIKHEPELSEAYDNMGCALFGKKDYTNAIVEFQKAIELNPKNAGSFKNEGVSYLNLNEKRKALDCFSKSYEIDSTDLQTVNLLGQTYKALGDTLKAKQYLGKVKRMTSVQKK